MRAQLCSSSRVRRGNGGSFARRGDWGKPVNYSLLVDLRWHRPYTTDGTVGHCTPAPPKPEDVNFFRSCTGGALLRKALRGLAPSTPGMHVAARRPAACRGPLPNTRPVDSPGCRPCIFHKTLLAVGSSEECESFLFILEARDEDPDMIICVCRRVSDRDIERHARQGCSSLDELQMETGLGTCCGQCTQCAVEVLKRCQQAAARQPRPEGQHEVIWARAA